MNVVLVGARGAGKSTVARVLAERLGARVLSTDRLVEERLGTSIASYVAARGWSAFRAVEREVVADLARRVTPEGGAVIDTGGGAPVDPANAAALGALGPVVYLHAPAATLAARIGDDPSRPALGRGRSPADEMAQVLREREPIYRALAGLVVDVSARSVSAVVDAIVAGLGLDAPASS